LRFQIIGLAIKIKVTSKKCIDESMGSSLSEIVKRRLEKKTQRSPRSRRSQSKSAAKRMNPLSILRRSQHPPRPQRFLFGPG